MRQHCLTLLLASSMLVASAPLRAVTVIWDGGGTTNNWTEADNWNGSPPSVPANPVPPASADLIQFAGTTRLNPVLGTDAWYVDRIEFNGGTGAAGAFILGNEADRKTITLRPTNNVTSHDGNEFLRNNSSSTQTIQDHLVVLGAGASNSTGSGINAVSGDLVLNGNLTMSGAFSGLRLKASGGRTVTINGVISGAPTGASAVNGGGTVILSNANNSFTNAMLIYNGTLKVTANALSGQNGALGNSTSAVGMGANTNDATNYTPALLIGAAATIGRDVELTTRTQGTGANSFTIGGDSAHISNYTGTITNSNGSGNAANAITLTAASGGRVNVNRINRTSTLNSANDQVTKTGLGIVALTGATASNYAGNTNINQGTFLVNGILSGTATGVTSVGSVIVSTNAALGGNGVINRNVTINTGGIFTPGDMNAGGVSLASGLTIGANLTLASNSILNFDLGTTSDVVSVTGALSLQGILNVANSGGFGVGNYKLFDYGTLNYTAGALSIGSTPNAGLTYAIDSTSFANAVYLVVTPEPGRALLLCTGLVVACLTRRRNRKVA